MNEAASLARKRTARAISTGAAMRFIRFWPAISSTNRARRSASFGRIMSVATEPGVSEFTRMPSRAHSLARVRVRLSIAALVAE
jgi:hypothetical protein